MTGSSTSSSRRRHLRPGATGPWNSWSRVCASDTTSSRGRSSTTSRTSCGPRGCGCCSASQQPWPAWRHLLNVVFDDGWLLLIPPLFGAWLVAGRGPLRVMLVVWTALYLFLILVVFHSEIRYRMPVVPYAMAGAAGGAALLARGDRRARAAALVVAVRHRARVLRAVRRTGVAGRGRGRAPAGRGPRAGRRRCRPRGRGRLARRGRRSHVHLALDPLRPVAGPCRPPRGRPRRLRARGAPARAALGAARDTPRAPGRARPRGRSARRGRRRPIASRCWWTRGSCWRSRGARSRPRERTRCCSRAATWGRCAISTSPEATTAGRGRGRWSA